MTTKNPAALERARQAVIAVGDGRGVIIEASDDRFVVTAAHCLPFLPPAHGASYLNERTYKDFLGPLNESKHKVWAECLFADPVSDIAVLGSPDAGALWDEAEAYEALMAEAPALQISDPPAQAPAWLLTLDGGWSQCLINHHGGPLWISGAAEGIVGGMSGSPIVADDATAIGLVCVSGGSPGDLHTEGGPNARLTHSLPGWFLLKLR